ncbi:MAG: type VI secretion system tip protein TssI/VgrG [Nannocystaceae bacterium]
MAHDGGGVDQGTLMKVMYDFICDEGPGGDWHVYRMRLMEEINGSYDLDLDLVTDELTADTDLFVGAAMQLDICRGDHIRTVYGIIMAVDYIGRSEDNLFVNIRVVPAFHLLGQQSHSRIFQEMSVLEILDEVLGAELGQYSRTLDKGAESRGTSPRDYCVQYRETDLDFCVRLMEEEGISYHFVHSEDAGHEVLTLTYENDDFTEVANVDGTPVVPIIVTRPESAELESIRNLDFLQTLTTTSHRRRDYDFLTPLELLEGEVEGADPKGYNRRIYAHTKRRYISDDVADRNQDHLEAAQVRGKVGRGSGNAIGFHAGKVFELERHIRDDLETQFLITRVVHTGECPEEILSTGSGGGGDGPRYRNSFECIPLDVPLRPRQITPKPRVYGPETGIVSGPSGEEIHVDEHGRIKVQFHWEEETTYDDSSSCWIRVRQQWSGPGWGFQFIPRIGQEVVVEFLGGNPDRPMVVGTVYNGDNSYPYPMPDSKTQSGIKTDSVSGDGSNELRFEDMSGSEEVYIHCQKDFTIATENDKNQTTGHDETLTIGNDRTKEVHHDQKELVKNDKTIVVEGNHTETIVKDMKLTVQANRSVTIVKDHDETITGGSTQMISKTKKVTVMLKSDEVVGAMKSVKVGGLYSEQVGASRSITAVGALSFTAGLSAKLQSAKSATVKAQKDLTLDGGKDTKMLSAKKMNIEAGDNMVIVCKKKATINAKDQLTVHVGKAKIILKKNGDITVEGKKVNIKGSGPVTIKGSKVAIN